MKTKNISVDELMSLSKAHRNGETMMKAAKPTGSFNESERSMRFIMSAEAQDRDGDIVMINGIDTEQFEKNPVGLWSHNHGAVIGGWSDLAKISGRPKRLEGTHKWAEEGTSPEVDKTFSLARQGFLRACSIGFLVDWKAAEGLFDDDEHFTGIKFNISTLLECSPCAIPANAAAMAKMAKTSEGRKFAREIMQDTLDNWPKSAAGVFMSRDDYESHLKTLEGERASKTVIDNEEGLFSRIAKRFGLKTAEKQEEPIQELSVEAVEPPVEDSPRALTPEEKSAAQARAEAVIKRAESTLAQGA